MTDTSDWTEVEYSPKIPGLEQVLEFSSPKNENQQNEIPSRKRQRKENHDEKQIIISEYLALFNKVFISKDASLTEIKECYQIIPDTSEYKCMKEHLLDLMVDKVDNLIVDAKSPFDEWQPERIISLLFMVVCSLNFYASLTL